ncbi:manganese efflux pump [bacterium]|nr:manganese efflux pump [bacterium]
MTLLSLILLAIALSIDACVVSFAHGLVLCDLRMKNSLLLSVFTGSAQGIMPIIGYFLAKPFYNMILPISKWLSFAIFLYLGLKFIQESFEKDKEVPMCLDLKCLLIISVATSIDALAAGVPLTFTSVNIFKAAMLIASTTFLFAFAGFWTSCFFTNFKTRYLEILAGLILIFIAIESLV